MYYYNIFCFILIARWQEQHYYHENGQWTELKQPFVWTGSSYRLVLSGTQPQSTEGMSWPRLNVTIKGTTDEGWRCYIYGCNKWHCTTSFNDQHFNLFYITRVIQVLVRLYVTKVSSQWSKPVVAEAWPRCSWGQLVVATTLPWCLYTSVGLLFSKGTAGCIV